jgi:Protein of unknown function (DUF3619)
MNEQHLALTITTTLDAGLRLKPETAARLKVARERALERHGMAQSGAAAVISGGGTTAWLGRTGGSWAQVGLSVACLLVALVGVHYWQEAHQAALASAQITEELVEVDSQVLTGDLPIKAYLDEDFQSWLKQSSQ